MRRLMSPELLLELGKGLLIIAVIAGAILGSVFMVMIVWVKGAAKGKLLSFFIEPNREVSTELLKLNPENPEKLDSKDGGNYILDPQRTYWYHWPASFPNFLRQPVPSSIYIRDRAEPLDLESARVGSKITAQTLRHMTDEGMFRQMWKDARDSIDETKGLSKTSIGLYISIGTLALLLGNAYLTWQITEQLSILVNSVQGGP